MTLLDLAGEIDHNKNFYKQQHMSFLLQWLMCHAGKYSKRSTAPQQTTTFIWSAENDNSVLQSAFSLRAKNAASPAITFLPQLCLLQLCAISLLRLVRVFLQQLSYRSWLILYTWCGPLKQLETNHKRINHILKNKTRGKQRCAYNYLEKMCFSYFQWVDSFPAFIAPYFVTTFFHLLHFW